MINKLIEKIILKIIRYLSTINSHSKIIDKLIYKFIEHKHNKVIKKIDIQIPINLMNEYQQFMKNDKEYTKKIVAKITGHDFSDDQWSNCKDLYDNLLKSIDKKIECFSDKSYQLGGLDLEIEVIAMLISQIDEPNLLEIGVANGYSSAFLYALLARIGGSIISIDLPRFSDGLRDLGEIREYLVKKGLVKNTKTLGDMNPGGVVPSDKYGGWLIPFKLRAKVRNVSIYGNVFNVLPEINDESLDVVVYDAMKPYESRMKCFELLKNKLSAGGFCFVDGYWVNSAFVDFCKRNNYRYETFGRVGVFKKTTD